MPTTRPRQVIADRYELGDLVGRGGMGDVYAAHDRRLDRPVALKLLRPELAADPAMRSRVEAEARASARLVHPNVVAVFDAGEDGERPFIAMELLSGRTLADRIAEGRLDDGEVRSLGEQVLAALGAAHAAGIVHRDVKPGNVLEAADGSWKVADFGIAKVTGGELGTTATGQIYGTASYLAPERVQGGRATPASDLYGTGVLLYEALTGERPFPGPDPIAVGIAIVEGTHPTVRSVRPEADPVLAEAIERAMGRRPEDRFPDAGAMARALRGDGPVTATPDDPDATAVVERPNEPTAVLPEVEVAGAGRMAPGPLPARIAPPLRRPSVRAFALGAVAAAILLAVVLVIALSGSGGPERTPHAGGPSTVTTSAPTTSLNDALDRLQRAVTP